MITQRFHPFITVLFFIYVIFVISGCSRKTKQHTQKPNTYQIDEMIVTKTEFDSLHKLCQNWFDSSLSKKGFNGGIIVAKHGQIIFEKYQGTVHPNLNDSINENTIFHIASTSKTFTSGIVLKLWQDKRLNIDTLYSAYFPDFNYPGVTIRSLLNHRSGLPNYLHFIDKLGYDSKKMLTNDDILHILITRKSELTDIEKPNTKFNYCNTNYVLLALLIEKITQYKYPDYIKKTIFDPLGMSSSFVFVPDSLHKITPSYDSKLIEFALTNLDQTYGDKNIYSTPRDLLKWDRLLSSNQFLSKETLAEAYKPYSNEKKGIKNYGLGWRMYNFPTGEKIIFHNGWWHGNNAVFIRLIKEDATIILLGNKFNKAIYSAKNISDLLNPSYRFNDSEDPTVIPMEFYLKTKGTIRKTNKPKR